MTTAQVQRRTYCNPTMAASPVPRVVWRVARLGSVGVLIGLLVTLVVVPGTGLFLFWNVLMPMLPLLLVVAPGLWRNVCPVAAINQVPRLLRLSAARPAPRWVQRHGYLVGAGLFVGIVATRRLVFESSGLALAMLLGYLLGASFVGGLWIKGKAGWCTTICPLVPVERLYGQTPFLTVRDRHCEPCVGCTRNCYDLNPHTAYLNDQHDTNRLRVLGRRSFAGLFPGLALWLFLVPAGVTTSTAFALLGVALFVSVGSFFLLDEVFSLPPEALPAVYGAVTLNCYYAFAAPLFFTGLRMASPWPGRGLRAAVLVLSLVWLRKTLQAGRQFRTARPSRRTLPLISP